jgi:hypothetical protein
MRLLVILIVSFAGNEHVEEVRRHLRAPHFVVDAAWLPASMSLSAELLDGRSTIRLRPSDDREVDLATVGAVWCRRLRPYRLHEDLRDGTARLMAWSECNEALLGVWYTMPCFWMNPPFGDEVAQRKIHQLRLAQRVGLSIPETCVTNDPAVARAFIERHGPGRVIRKVFRNIPEAPRQTALVGNAELRLLDAVRYAPVIFQRYVEAVADLRVTIVDGDVFAAEIRSDHEEVDYRVALGSAEVRPCTLPDDVTERLRRLMRLLGVVFGAIDLRLTAAGEYVFLEINPAGEYLFVSQRTGLPIPAAIAATLERHDREGQSGAWGSDTNDSDTSEWRVHAGAREDGDGIDPDVHGRNEFAWADKAVAVAVEMSE